MEAYKFETTVLENGIIKIPEISKYKNQDIEIFIILKPQIKSKNPTFEQWNKQFADNQNLDDFIPEYGTTLREFRKGIYEAEMSGDMTMSEFKESLKQ